MATESTETIMQNAIGHYLMKEIVCKMMNKRIFILHTRIESLHAIFP